jgi:GST-like protein
MIELFFCTSVNVYKILIAFEEMGLAHEIRLIDISKGEQLDPATVAGSPTGKLPVIRDNAPADGGPPRVVFESGAILQYLAEKTGQFLPAAPRARMDAMQWLFWQTSNLGPVTGQAWHFRAFAPRIAPDVDNQYSYNRYFHMMAALWRVMDTRLAEQPYLAGEYSIADMACYPWIIYLDPLEGMEAFPNIARWRDEIAARPAVQRVYERVATFKTGYEFNREKSMAFYPWDGVLKHMITT